jgi:hypothetical protein
MISFILETISLRDADFGLPDFGAFLMHSTPDSRGQSSTASKSNPVLSEL